jgi:S1-C subfamily serine protease
MEPLAPVRGGVDTDKLGAVEAVNADTTGTEPEVTEVSEDDVVSAEGGDEDPLGMPPAAPGPSGAPLPQRAESVGGSPVSRVVVAALVAAVVLVLLLVVAVVAWFWRSPGDSEGMPSVPPTVAGDAGTVADSPRRDEGGESPQGGPGSAESSPAAASLPADSGSNRAAPDQPLAPATTRSDRGKLQTVLRSQDATALLVLPSQQGFATAFCVDPRGFLATNAHAVGTLKPADEVTIVVRPGQAKQRVAQATVVRIERRSDLALLRLAEPCDMPALEVGSLDALQETLPLTAFGYARGNAAAVLQKRYPRIVAKKGAITSLRRVGRDLVEIQFDGRLVPGYDGAPVVNAQGQLIGIVHSGIVDARVHFVIPANQLQKLLEPEIRFTPPPLTRSNLQQLATFEVQATCFRDPDTPLELQLRLKPQDGPEQQQTMKLSGGVYRATLVPVPTTGTTQPATNEIYSIGYVIVVRQAGQEVGRLEGTIPVGPQGSQIVAPQLGGESREIALPADVADVAVGGRGRWLILHLFDTRQLAVFDVSVAKIVHCIPLSEEQVLFAAGLDRLLVFRPQARLVERWSLLTLARETSAKLDLAGQLDAVSMGSGSQGPVLVHSVGRDRVPMDRRELLDVATLKLAPLPGKPMRHRTGPGLRIRASSDGRVFGFWQPNVSPCGLETLVLDEATAASYSLHETVGHVVPGPDGRYVYAALGVYTAQAKKAGNVPPGTWFVPAHHGDLFLGIPGTPGVYVQGWSSGEVAVFRVGDVRPIRQLPQLQYQSLCQRDAFLRERLSLDQRVHLLPEAKVIVTIPSGKRRLVLHPFDPDRGGPSTDQIAAAPPGQKRDDAAEAAVPNQRRHGAADATVLVVLPSRKGFGSGFCVDRRGYFITNDHVVEGVKPGQQVTIVLHAGDPAEREVQANIVWSVSAADLALLHVPQAENLAALPLGDEATLAKGAPVTALGFPFGDALAVTRKRHPHVSVNQGPIRALSTGSLGQQVLEFETQVNPGNSGGPVVNAQGQVVGVVKSTVLGGSASFAIPVSLLKGLLAQPHLRFTPPTLKQADLQTPATFEAQAVSLLDRDERFELELRLKTADGPERRQRLEYVDGVYRAAMSSVAATDNVPLKAAFEFADGTLTGVVADRPLTVGRQEVRLREIRRLQAGTEPHAVLHNGRTLAGAISGLQGMSVRMGQFAAEVDCSRAIAAQFTGHFISAVRYELVAMRDKKEVARLSGTIPVEPPPDNSGANGVEYRLPAPVADVAVGGSGRWLVLYLPGKRELAIFDVVTAQIVQRISVPDADVRFAAGLQKLLVLLPNSREIQRWDLRTSQREATAPLPVEGPIHSVHMDPAGRGPLGVRRASEPHSRDAPRYALIDVETLKAADWAVGLVPRNAGGRPTRAEDSRGADPQSPGGEYWAAVWSASPPDPDPRNPALSGGFVASYRVAGPAARYIYMPRGIETCGGKALLSVPRALGLIPAHHGNYFLGFPTPRSGSGYPELAIYGVGETRPLGTLPINLEQLGPGKGLAFEKRLHLVPKAKKLVAIPAADDRLILYAVDVEQMIKDAAFDCLLVTSQPPTTAAKSQTLTYQLAVESRVGGLAYHVEAGPPGMTISPSGLLEWTVPSDFTASDVPVIVSIRNASGEEKFHSFHIAVP